MDDEKSIRERLTDVIGKAAGSVKSAVSHVVDTVSDAAQHAMESNAEKISRIPPAKSEPEQIAGTTSEIYIPQASDAAAMPMPLVPAASTPKQAAAAKAKPDLSGRITPAYGDPAPKSKMPTPVKKKAAKKAIAKKTARKPAKKAAKRSPAKKSESSVGKKSVGKNKKKTIKKAKKSKRSSRRS
jgi:hypothetical protein